MLRSGFEQLVGKPLRRTITVDCAYGVGAIALSPIRDAFASMLDIVVCNLPGEGELNAGCGAEFVQKKQLRPAGTPGPGPFASFDGDADRIVYHFELNGKWTLLDGDKIACLLATYVMQQLSELPNKSDYEFGVV